MKTNRGEDSGSIKVEVAEVLRKREAPEGQWIVRLKSPACARAARAGQFVHLQCAVNLPMRRPYSILSTSPEDEWIEILFAIRGQGSKRLAAAQLGDVLSSMGPIGRPFTPTIERTQPLLLGGGVGMPPILFLAEELAKKSEYSPLVMLASERPFPFDAAPASDECAALPLAVNLSLSRLNAIGVSGRLASGRGYDGCYSGYIHDMAALWLAAQSREELSRVEMFVCGPPLMIKACAALAAQYELPCQVSLEEHMACAVGGCAGCAVPVYRDERRDMQRVCVDGPVFNAHEIYPDLFSAASN